MKDWYAERIHPPTAIFFVVFVLVIIASEGFYQVDIRKESTFNEPHIVIKKEEFDERVKEGEQLVILDDLVLDISKYKPNHPGGRFVLDFNIGRDISKFIYGGYILENRNGMRPHTHSNIARRIINTLIIGRLEENAKLFTAKIQHKTPVNSNVSTFIMQIEGPDPNFILPSSTDIHSIGKHFLVRSYTRPNVRRHYTLSTCMRKELYDEYI